MHPSLLNSGHSGHDISSCVGLHHTTTSRICRKHCSDLQMSQLDILQSFLRLILAMPNTLSPLGRLRMPPSSLKLLDIRSPMDLQQSPSCTASSLLYPLHPQICSISITFPTPLYLSYLSLFLFSSFVHASLFH